MTDNNNDQLTRRELGRRATPALAAIAAGSSLTAARAARALPRRQLGKTGMEVSLLGLGSAQDGYLLDSGIGK